MVCVQNQVIHLPRYLTIWNWQPWHSRQFGNILSTLTLNTLDFLQNWNLKQKLCSFVVVFKWASWTKWFLTKKINHLFLYPMCRIREQTIPVLLTMTVMIFLQQTPSLYCSKAGDPHQPNPWSTISLTVTDQCNKQQVRTHCTLTFTMNVKSVKAGEYTAPPAQGPIMREIWGTTPEHRTFLCNRKKNRHLVFTPSPKKYLYL